MKITLRVWRQKDAKSEGRFVTYEAPDVSEDMSFLEMLDVVNERLIEKGEEPIAFDHDCREGICGTCGVVINGRAARAAGADDRLPAPHAQLQGRRHLTIEPWRADAFPVIKDLVVDRSAFDRIIAAGGFISAPIGSAPDGNAIPVPKESADLAMDAAACIGCGACVAACPNASRDALHLGEDLAPRAAAAGPARAAATASSAWSRRWTPRASAPARTTASARRSARRASAWSSSRG